MYWFNMINIQYFYLQWMLTKCVYMLHSIYKTKILNDLQIVNILNKYIYTKVIQNILKFKNHQQVCLLNGGYLQSGG